MMIESRASDYFLDSATGRSEYLFRPRPRLDPRPLAPDAAGADRRSRRARPLRSYLTLPLGDVNRRTCPWCCWCTAGRGRATRGGTSPRSSSSPTAATPCCRSTTGARRGSARRSCTRPRASSPGKMHDDLIDAVEWAVGEGHRRPCRGSPSTAGRTAGTPRSSALSFTPERVRRRHRLRRAVEPGHAHSVVSRLLAPVPQGDVVPLRRGSGHRRRAEP